MTIHKLLGLESPCGMYITIAKNHFPMWYAYYNCQEFFACVVCILQLSRTEPFPHVVCILQLSRTFCLCGMYLTIVKNRTISPCGMYITIVKNFFPMWYVYYNCHEPFLKYSPAGSLFVRWLGCYTNVWCCERLSVYVLLQLTEPYCTPSLETVDWDAGFLVKKYYEI